MYGYSHCTVNQNFVDPNTGAHTQQIESMWSQIKKLMREEKTMNSTLFETYLPEFMWRKKYDYCKLDVSHFPILFIQLKNSILYTNFLFNKLYTYSNFLLSYSYSTFRYYSIFLLFFSFIILYFFPSIYYSMYLFYISTVLFFTILFYSPFP